MRGPPSRPSGRPLSDSVFRSFSSNTGKLLGNLVFLALRQRTPEVYYYTSPSGYAVDFYLPETREPIQVSQSLAQPATRERETRALTAALRGLDLTHGLILTDANAGSFYDTPIETDGLTLEVRSLNEQRLAPPRRDAPERPGRDHCPAHAGRCGCRGSGRRVRGAGRPAGPGAGPGTA